MEEMLLMFDENHQRRVELVEAKVGYGSSVVLLTPNTHKVEINKIEKKRGRRGSGRRDNTIYGSRP